VHLRGHTEKLLREAGPGIERGRHVPIQPADAVLPGGEANLVVGRWRREVLVAPGVGHLAGKPGVARLKPGVARLRNGDHVKAVLAKQHHSFSSIARTTAMHPGEMAMAAKNSQGTGINRRAGKSSLVEPTAARLTRILIRG